MGRKTREVNTQKVHQVWFPKPAQEDPEISTIKVVSSLDWNTPVQTWSYQQLSGWGERNTSIRIQYETWIWSYFVGCSSIHHRQLSCWLTAAKERINARYTLDNFLYNRKKGSNMKSLDGLCSCDRSRATSTFALPVRGSLFLDHPFRRPGKQNSWSLFHVLMESHFQDLMTAIRITFPDLGVIILIVDSVFPSVLLHAPVLGRKSSAVKSSASWSAPTETDWDTRGINSLPAKATTSQQPQSTAAVAASKHGEGPAWIFIEQTAPPTGQLNKTLAVQSAFDPSVRPEVIDSRKFFSRVRGAFSRYTWIGNRAGGKKLLPNKAWFSMIGLWSTRECMN